MKNLTLALLLFLPLQAQALFQDEAKDLPVFSKILRGTVVAVDCIPVLSFLPDLVFLGEVSTPRPTQSDNWFRANLFGGCSTGYAGTPNSGFSSSEAIEKKLMESAGLPTKKQLLQQRKRSGR